MRTANYFIGLMATCLALEARAAEITQVTVRQRWPWNRLVNLDYVLSGSSSEKTDITVSGTVGSEAVGIPESSLSGDLYGVSGGFRRIVWDPTQTACTNNGILPDFRVTLNQTNSPVYMIVDLTNTIGTLAQVEYIYPGDSRLVTEGRYTNVWFDMTNDIAYKTDKLVLRRVHAGAFNMGTAVPPTLAVTLTKDFYVGVFEVTQAQWKNIKGAYPSVSDFTNGLYRATRPAEKLAYDAMRGSAAEGGGGWPTNDAVSTSSFIGQLRSKTGINGFDLPTEAQWEYACRSGTTTYYSDGIGTPSDVTSNAQMNVLGRYKYNGGGSGDINCTTESGTAKVGSYRPNNWGLYDMHGNVWEFCLDWYADSLGTSSVTDPEGPAFPPNPGYPTRVKKGGRFGVDGSYARSACRMYDHPSASPSGGGFRVAIRLP